MVDINELTGYIAAIGSTTRESGAIVGNGLKTIMSRITTIDGAEKILGSANVAMRDMVGNVRPVSDIITDLASHWASLSKEQQQNTAVSLAGRYQLSRFLALMNNFSVAQNATTTAINSSGSAMKEQNKYANSLEARINRLDTAWNKFTLAVGGAVLTDGLIGGIESLNDLATGVAKLVDKFGILSSVFGIIGVATVGLSTKFKTLATGLIFGTQGMTRMQLASAGLTTGMTRLGIATTGFKNALRGLASATVVGAIFVALGFAIEKLIGAYSDAKQAQEKFEASQQKGVDALTKNKVETEKLIEQYNNLTEAKKEAGENWSGKQEEQYLQIQQRLAELYPQLIGYIDGAGNKHIKSKQEIEKEIEATNRLIAAKKEEIKVNAATSLNKKVSERNDVSGDLKDKESFRDYLSKSGGEGGAAFAKTKVEIEQLQSKWSTAQQKITSEVLKIASAYTNLEIDPSIKQGVDNFVSSLDLSKLNPSQLEGYSQKIGQLTNEMQEAYKSGNEVNFDKAKQSLIDYAIQMGATKQQAFSFAMSFDNLKKAAEQGATAVFAGKDGMDGLDESVSDLNGNMSGLSGETNGLAGAFGGLEGAANGASGALDGNINAASILFGVTSDEIQVLQNAIAVFQALSGQANLTQQQQLMLANATNILAAQYPQLNGQIAENIGWISSQAGMMSSLSDVSGANAATMIQNQNATTKATIAQINQRIAGYQKEAAALNGLIARIEAAYEMEGMSGAKSYAYNHATTRLGELNASMASAQASKVEAYYSSGVKTGQVKPYDGSDKKSKDSGGGSKDKDKGQSAFEKYIDQMDARIAESEARAEALDRTSKAYQNEINTQWELQTAKAKKYQEEIARLTKSQGANSEEVLKLRESYAQLQGEIAALNWEYYDAEIQRYSDKVADLSDEIEYSKKVMELHSDSFAINQIETEKQISLYEDQMKLLDQERATMERAIKNGYLNAAQKKEMQERLDALNKEYIDYEINIKNATDALEEQRKAEQDAIKQKADDFIDAYKAYYEKKKELDEKALDDELSAYEKMVNDKIALIDKEEQARDDSRELSDKQKEISSIQAQINALSGDSSQAGKVSELRKQLAEKQSDLGEYVHDKEVEQRKDALNNELEQKRSQIEEEKKLMDEHYENLLNDERKFAEMREQIMNGNVLYFQSMLSLFTQDVQNNMGEIGKSISENLIDKLAEASDGLSDAKQEFDNMSKVYSGSDMNVSGTDTAKEDKVTIQEDTPLLKKTANGYEYSGTTLKKGSTYKAYGVNSKDGVYLVGGNGYVTADPKFTKYQRFDTGGYTKNGEGFAMLHEKEIVLNKMDTANFLKAVDITRQIASMLPKFSIPKIIPNNVANQHQTINMNINIEHMNGTKQGVNDFFKDINNALRSKGGMLFT